MDKLELQKYIGIDYLTVSEAMQMIDNNASGILFLTDKMGLLIGCITDGDIRRFLLGSAADFPLGIPSISLRQALHHIQLFRGHVIGPENSIRDILDVPGQQTNRPG